MTRRIRRSLFTLVLGIAVLAASPAAADEYDPEQAGHPLRVAAYLLHPVGVLLDVLFFRPAHWMVTREPFNTIFGHEDC